MANIFEEAAKFLIKKKNQLITAFPLMGNSTEVIYDANTCVVSFVVREIPLYQFNVTPIATLKTLENGSILFEWAWALPNSTPLEHSLASELAKAGAKLATSFSVESLSVKAEEANVLLALSIEASKGLGLIQIKLDGNPFYFSVLGEVPLAIPVC